MSNFVYYNTLAAIGAFLVWLVIRRIDTWIGIILYGLGLIALRLGRSGFRSLGEARQQWRDRHKAPPLPKVALMAKDTVKIHRLKPAEVILGYHHKTGLRINLRKHHTIIGSTPGFGKTTIINSCLVQLFSKGEAFTKDFDVIVVDLKGDNENDYLDLWQPVVWKYYSIHQNNVSGAIGILEEIVAEMRLRNQKKGGKFMLLFIDEIAMLTIRAGGDRSKSEELLFELANLGRTRLTIIGATQNPHHKVMATLYRHAFDRRICLPVADEGHASLIMGRNIKKDDIPTRAGEFIMFDPEYNRMGFAQLVRGRAMALDLPVEINLTVNGLIDARMKGDPRLTLFASVASGVEIGESIIGINKVAGDTYKRDFVESAYRHYAQAGAFNHTGKRGETYKLACTYPRAVQLVMQYIESGNWTQAQKVIDLPKTQVKEISGETNHR